MNDRIDPGERLALRTAATRGRRPGTQQQGSPMGAIFNVFPLIYSLGYSFTDFRASTNAPANFVGLQNYRELLNDPFIWNNFSITAKYVIVSVIGQVIVGFGTAMLLNRDIPMKGLITTLHYGDNLTVLRDSIPSESVDLIYLDPPFNSNAGYNVLFKAPDEIAICSARIASGIASSGKPNLRSCVGFIMKFLFHVETGS